MPLSRLFYSLPRIKLAELTADILLGVMLFGVIENLRGLAELHKIAGSATLCCVHIEETGLVRDSLRLLQIVGYDGDGVAGFQLHHQFFDPACGNRIESGA